ncbi:MAG: guanylate kinase [Lachnospiraceae bacterium]|jgi:guanylate kinase|nr:guanylate kinase [Lachnospiraceae bacterium]
MGKIFYIMGKSSTGKDTIFEELLGRRELDLHNIVLYTTRPIRAKETEGVQYYFVDEDRLEQLLREGKVIELRAYDTVCGVWKYFTVDDGRIDLRGRDYLAIGTLVSYEKMRHHFGEDALVPIYIEVDDGLRLERALRRERKQSEPRYEEMCRRFLADAADFSEGNLKSAGIQRRFLNNGDRAECMDEVARFILENKGES